MNPKGVSGITLLSCFLFLVLIPGLSSWAGPSGLIVIPTTEVLPRGEFALEFEGEQEFFFPVDPNLFLNTEFGITDFLEVGVDFDLKDLRFSTTTFNAKALFAHSRNNRWSLAGGTTTIFENGPHSDPFIVSSTSIGDNSQVHAGIIRTAGFNRLMAGFHHSITDRAVIMADYIDGAENESSVGFAIELTEHVAFEAGLVRANDGGDIACAFLLVISGSFWN